MREQKIAGKTEPVALASHCLSQQMSVCLQNRQCCQFKALGSPSLTTAGKLSCSSTVCVLHNAVKQ